MLAELEAACLTYAQAKAALVTAVNRAEDGIVIFAKKSEIIDAMEAVVRRSYGFNRAIESTQLPVAIELETMNARMIATSLKERDDFLTELENQRRALNQLRRGEITPEICKLQTMMLDLRGHWVDELSSAVLNKLADSERKENSQK